MNNEDKDQITLRYNYQDFLDLLCTYEGELQARDVIIDCILNKQQQFTLSSSSSTLPSTTITQKNALQSLVKDSLYINSSNLKTANRCFSCSNNLLTTAKFLLSQREADLKIEKCLDVLSEKHSKCMEELLEKHKNIKQIAKVEDKYVKDLENEREELFEQLKNRQIELTELDDEKTKIEQKHLEEKEREKLLVLFLLEERAKLLKEIGELRALNKTCTALSECSTSSNDSSNLKLAYANLEEENKQLHKSLRHVHSEKTILQKRLDFLLRDLQQNEFQRQFQFLQPRTGSISEKEMILIGPNNNNSFNNTMPPSFPTTFDKIGRINKIKNSSSFPQSFDNNVEQLKQQQQQNLVAHQRPPIERRKHSQQGQQQVSSFNNFNINNSSSSVVPLIVGHSTTTLTNNKRSSPRQQQPKTNAYNNFQQYNNYKNNPNGSSSSGTFEQMKKYHQQPQTVICRRSTSLPRRIISAAQFSPSSSSKQFPQHHPSEQQQRNNFYQKPPIMGTNYANNNKHL